MRTNDQYFKPGDKVMRVNPNATTGGLSYSGPGPVMGVVYCVEGFWAGPSFNVVMLVGFGGWRFDSIGRKVGWRAAWFRRVEELKLCTAAVQRVNKPAGMELAHERALP